MRALCGGVLTSPLCTVNTLLAAPSVTRPSRSSTASTAPDATACWRSRILGSSEIDLMSQRAQRVSARVMAAAPRVWCRLSAAGTGIGALVRNTVGATGGSGKA
jgi:hypothetical protein